MIIFGTRRSERPVESGSFQCPVCETTRAYRRTIGRSWFTLYFLPVFPISGKQDQAECQGCFHRFDGGSVSDRFGGRPLGAPSGIPSGAPSGIPLGVTSGGGEYDPFSVAPGPATLAAAPDGSRPMMIPQVSGLAVASLVAAIFSPFLILACGMSLISSIVAIVTGHMAVAAVARSGGGLRGTGMARCGLAGGYLFALLSVAFIGWLAYTFQNADRGMPVADANPGEAVLDAAAADRTPAESLADGVPEESAKMLVDREAEPRSGAGSDEPTSRVARGAVQPPTDSAVANEDPFAGGRPATPGRFEPGEAATADPFASTPPRSGRPVLGRGAGGSSRRDPDPDPVAEPPPADLLGQFPDLGWAVKSLAFSPDGQLLAAGKQDQTVLVLDLQSFRVADRRDGLRQIDQVTGVAFSNDGRRLIATGSRGNHVSWAVDSSGRLGPASDLAPSADGAQSLAASPAAGFIAIGGARGEVLWQSLAASRSPAKRLAALDKAILAIHLPHSGYSAMASDGSSLIRFDLRQAAVTDQTSLGRGSAMAAAFSPDGERMAICAGAEVRVYETDRGQLERTLSAAREIQWSAAFLPGGKRLVTGGRGQATLWDLESGAPLQRFDLGGVLYIQTLAVSADGTRLAAVPAAAGQTLSVFRLEPGE